MQKFCVRDVVHLSGGSVIFRSRCHILLNLMSITDRIVIFGLKEIGRLEWYVLVVTLQKLLALIC